MKFGHVLFPKEKKTLLKECKLFKMLVVIFLSVCVVFRGFVGSLNALHFHGHVSFIFLTIFRFDDDLFVGFYKEVLQQMTLMMEALNLQRFLL